MDPVAGAESYRAIYRVVRQIPEGMVATYGQVATLAGLPGHARQVGYALHALADGSGVPWHRVINARGRVSRRADPGYERLQRALLEAEGVVFEPSSHVSLARFGWRRRLPANAALIIIDVQKAIDDPSWGERNNPHAEANMQRLLAAWRATRRPIVHVRHLSTEPNSTYRPGQEGCEFKDAVWPLTGEHIVDKRTNSAFIRTNLEDHLRAERADTLIVVGVITNNSVEATARMAGNLGYTTYVVADATATFGRNDFNGVQRTADEVHAMSLANLQGEYAEIVLTDDVLERVAS